MSSTLLTRATVVTLGESNQVIDDAGVLVEGARIARVGPRAELEKEFPAAEKIELPGKVIMPGSVNVHDHLYSALARGISMTGEPPQNFVQILERLWWRLDLALTDEDVYYSGLLGFIEAARRGTTTLIDHHASPSAIGGSLDQLARGSKLVGIRGCYCYEVTDRNGPAGAQEGIDENVRFLKRCAEEKDPFLAAAFGLHASFTVGPATLERCLEAAPAGSFFHVHVAEDFADVAHSHENYSKPALQRLMEGGLKDFPTLAAHCIHLEESEYPLLTQHDISVLHNPESNMNNAVGCAAVRRMLASGVTVGLGTDGMTQDLFPGVRTLPLAHRLIANHPQSFGWDEVYKVAFLNNPKIAGRFFPEELGHLSEGAAADLMVLDYIPPTPLTGGNFLGHFLFGLSSAPVTMTMAGGRVIMRDGKVLGVNEEEVFAKCRELAQKLWNRW